MCHYFAGKWNVWNLSLFLDGAETKARESGVFMNWPSFPAKSISLVMIKLVLNINPKVYPFDFMEKRNLRITTHLNEPGTTSYNITTTLTNDDSEILVERYAKLGRIDNETRRPVKNPEEFLKAFSYLKNKGSPPALTKTDIPKTPTDCFKWCLTTRYSDLDSKLHANQSLYIKSCIDCVTHVSKNGKLVPFHGDMIWYPVTYLAINYLGESFANDELVVNMWQEEVSLFNFSIYKSTTQVAYIVCKFGIDLLKH
jgi:acyl-CoA thioesterase FadM